MDNPTDYTPGEESDNGTNVRSHSSNENTDSEIRQNRWDEFHVNNSPRPSIYSTLSSEPSSNRTADIRFWLPRINQQRRRGRVRSQSRWGSSWDAECEGESDQQSSSRKESCFEWNKPKLMLHAVNTLSIIKKYIPQPTDAFKRCQYLPREHEYFDFNNVNSNPLEFLNPEDFDCRTKVLVLIRDKRSYSIWGSHWSSLLLEELIKKKVHSMCFTLKSQMCVKSLACMLEILPDDVRKKLDLLEDDKIVEKFVVMSTLAKLFRDWSVPTLVIDYAPKGILDYKSILNFAKKFSIKVITFGVGNKTSTFDMEDARMKSRAKASEIKKAVKEMFKAEFRSKLEDGYFSMQSVRSVKNPEAVCDEIYNDACTPFSSSVSNLSMFVDSGSMVLNDVNYTPLAISIPEACCRDWNEWLEWEQPYYDKRDEIRKQNKTDLSDKNDKEVTLVEEPNQANQNQSDDDWESISKSGSQEDDCNFRSYPRFGGRWKNTRKWQNKKGTTSTANKYKNKNKNLDIFNDPDLPDLVQMSGPRTAFEKSPRRTTTLSVASSSKESNTSEEDEKESKNNLRCKPHYKIKRMKLESGQEISPVIDDMPNNTCMRTRSKSMSDPFGKSEIKLIKRLQSESLKNTKLKRLQKYYKKMKHAYQSMLKESTSYPSDEEQQDESDFIGEYSDGKSCCMKIKPDEWDLYRKPITEVLSPYDIDYLNKTLEDLRLPYSVPFSGFVMLETTSNFLDTIIQVCCGTRQLPGPIEFRQRIRTIIFIHDNNDVLVLLATALWFSGKTVVASCQKTYYDRDEHFEKSLEACKTYIREETRDEDIFLDWIGIGLNGVLKQDEYRFIIVDFPRPGKELSYAFDTMMKRLKVENDFRGIETLYVSKSSSRKDNLATVENVLDQLQDRMTPKERIVFRRSRKMYLDIKLCHNYQCECLEENETIKNWGLPETKGNQQLWEQLRLQQLQMFSKSDTTNTNESTPKDPVSGDELSEDFVTTEEDSEGDIDITVDGGYTDELETTFLDNDELDLQLFQDGERLSRELDILHAIGSRNMESSCVPETHLDEATTHEAEIQEFSEDDQVVPDINFQINEITKGNSNFTQSPSEDRSKSKTSIISKRNSDEILPTLDKPTSNNTRRVWSIDCSKSNETISEDALEHALRVLLSERLDSNTMKSKLNFPDNNENTNEEETPNMSAAKELDFTEFKAVSLKGTNDDHSVYDSKVNKHPETIIDARHFSDSTTHGSEKHDENKSLATTSWKNTLRKMFTHRVCPEVSAPKISKTDASSLQFIGQLITDKFRAICNLFRS